MNHAVSYLLNEAEMCIATALRSIISARENADVGFPVTARTYVTQALQLVAAAGTKLGTAHEKLGSAESSPEATNDPHKNTTAASNPSTATNSNVESEELG